MQSVRLDAAPEAKADLFQGFDWVDSNQRYLSAQINLGGLTKIGERGLGGGRHLFVFDRYEYIKIDLTGLTKVSPR